MIASDFVKALTETAPSIDALRRRGLSEATAIRVCRGFLCPQREIPLPISDSNEVLKLMKYWDTHNIEIGALRLLDKPVKSQIGIQVGVVEADPLIVSNADGGLFTEEFGVAGHVLWEVAGDTASLLAALVVAARFLEDRGSGKIGCDDFGVARAAARECATLAGGEKYSDFYTMLLGAEP